MMRILMILDNWFPLTGGGPVHVRELISELARRGHTVDLLTRSLIVNGRHVMHAEDLPGGGRVYRLGRPAQFFSLPARLAFLRLAEQFGEKLHAQHAYDLIHAHAHAASLIAARLARKLGIPSILTLHGFTLAQPARSIGSRLMRRIEHFLIFQKHCHIITVHKDPITYAQKYGLRIPMSHIPNGVRLSIFTPSQIPLTERPVDYLYLGRFNPEKGVNLLVEALILHAKKHGWHGEALLIGHGPEESRLSHRIQQAGLEEQILLKPPILPEEAPRVYSTARLFILPSQHEGFPLTILESLAVGTPVLAFAVEGVKDVARVFKSITLVPQRDPNILANALQKPYLYYPEDRERIEEEYSWEHIAERTLHIYDSCLSTRQNRPL